jgi:hypothetical protein
MKGEVYGKRDLSNLLGPAKKTGPAGSNEGVRSGDRDRRGGGGVGQGRDRRGGAKK